MPEGWELASWRGQRGRADRKPDRQKTETDRRQKETEGRRRRYAEGMRCAKSGV